MILADGLRPPSALDPTAAAYKDWLHLNVLDHATGAIGLINVSLHGAPADPRSRAIGTALLHLPGSGWTGNVEVAGIDEASIGPASIGLERIALAIDQARGAVLASVQLPEDDLTLDLTAVAASAPVDVDRRVPLGPGWISWRAVPRLELRGGGTAAGEPLDFSGASAYHDHNWGRWHWGEDLGWEWGCFLTPVGGPGFIAVIFSRTTDRAHRRAEGPLVVAVTDRRRSFSGGAVDVSWSGLLESAPRRVPGAMAALHSDQAAPRLPERLRIRADDGVDRVQLDFVARAAAQLVAADPARQGYGFVHELVGAFSFVSRLGTSEQSGAGLAVVEYVR